MATGLRTWPAATRSTGIGSEMTRTLCILRDHVLTSMSPSTATSTAGLTKLTRGSGGNLADAEFQGEKSLLQQLRVFNLVNSIVIDSYWRVIDTVLCCFFLKLVLCCLC